jgi:hypothetical protein
MAAGFQIPIAPRSPLPGQHKLDFSPSNHLVVYVQGMTHIMSGSRKSGGMTWEEARWIESIRSVSITLEGNASSDLPILIATARNFVVVDSNKISSFFFSDRTTMEHKFHPPASLHRKRRPRALTNI